MNRDNVIGIYKITCKSNNKVYIGSSKNIGNRWKSHLKNLKRNKHHSPYLQNSFNKYGINDFTFEIIEECDLTVLLDREQYYLDLYKPYDRLVGFNCLCTAGGGFKQHKISETTKQKLTDKLKGNSRRRGIKGKNRELPVSIYLKSNMYEVSMLRKIIDQSKQLYILGYFKELQDAVNIYNYFNNLDSNEFLIEYEKLRNKQALEKRNKSTSKYKNVYLVKNNNTWSYKIRYKNINYTKHNFSTEDDAYTALLELKQQLGI